MGRLELIAYIFKVIESCKTFDQRTTCWNWIEKANVDGPTKVAAYNKLLGVSDRHNTMLDREPRG